MNKTKFNKLRAMVLMVSLFQLVLVGNSFGQAKKEIKVGSFHTISVNSDFDVTIRQSNTQSVEAKVNAELWPSCNIWVDNGVLHVDVNPIEGKKSVMDRLEDLKGVQMELFVTVKSLNKIIANGNGKIKSENSINSTNLEIEQNGNGSIDIDVKASNVTANIYSKGELTLSGYTDVLNLQVTGDGQFKGLNFDAKNVKASIHGMETLCQVSVSESLTITMKGNGEFYYKGTPGKITKHIYGKGKVLQR